MKGRLSALAVAIVLVVGSFLVRREIIDDDNGDPSEQQADELVCITELADVCAAYAAGNDSVTVTVEDAGVTLDRLAAIDSDTEPPLWLTVEPYPAMVDSIRAGTRAEPLGYSTNVLAASQLGVALPPDGRLDVLLAACDGQPLWRCIGTNAGVAVVGARRRGALGHGAPSPRRRRRLGARPVVVRGQRRRLLRRRRRQPQPMGERPRLHPLARRPRRHLEWRVIVRRQRRSATMATRPSALDIAATAGFELATVDADSQRFARNYPAPEMWLQAVLAVPGGAAAGDLAAELTELLRTSGWDDAATATTPVPSASTMLALRAYWHDAV